MMWLQWVAVIPPKKRVLGSETALATEDTGHRPSAMMLARRTSILSNARTQLGLIATPT
jgi:hypothetical protein